MELKMQHLWDEREPRRVAIRGQCVVPNTLAHRLNGAVTVLGSSSCFSPDLRASVVKPPTFDSPFPSRYRCPHERSQSHSPVRNLAGPTHTHRPERPPAETFQYGGRCLHVFPRHLLPLGATMAASLSRPVPRPKSPCHRRSPRRKLWHLARH